METLFIGKSTIFLPETESTNSYAINLLKKVNLAEGTLIYTAKQKKGKGQRGSSWIAQDGENVTASLVLCPSFLELKKQFYLYIITALACYDTTAELLKKGQFDIKIKWPNDILVGRKKLCGILIENQVIKGRLSHSVIGIGLNVNQHYFKDIENAISVALVSGKNFEITAVLELLCSFFEKYYLALKANRYEILQKEYLKKMFGYQKRVSFEIKGKEKRMLVKGIGNTGLLHLQDDKGNNYEYDVKEVKWLY